MKIDEKEIVEICPHCGGENIYSDYKGDFVTRCKHCGEEILLCDVCLHSDDNPSHKCDWDHTPFGGKCFRGETKLN